ncbi:hypothetical protein QTP88_018128 [Uroleucon formosanum]
MCWTPLVISKITPTKQCCDGSVKRLPPIGYKVKTNNAGMVLLLSNQHPLTGQARGIMTTCSYQIDETWRTKIVTHGGLFCHSISIKKKKIKIARVGIVVGRTRRIIFWFRIIFFTMIKSVCRVCVCECASYYHRKILGVGGKGGHGPVVAGEDWCFRRRHCLVKREWRFAGSRMNNGPATGRNTLATGRFVHSY